MARTEEQNYRLVKSFGDFEIRHYPSSTLATVYSTARTYRDLSGPGFRALAGYIFGGNETDTKIAMTAPVHMDLGKERSSMSFVMPSGYSAANLPKPDNTRVVIGTTEAEYLAVIRFGGWAGDETIRQYSEKLAQLLEKEGIPHQGNFRYLGYNPPYQLIGRRNEIVVSVSWPDAEVHENDKRNNTR